MRRRLRVAGSFVLLDGHPVSRVAAMRPHQVEADDNGVYLVIGPHRALLPPALRVLVVELRDSAPPASIFGSSASTSDWLFPGLVPGQHLADKYLVKLLNGAGIRTRTARNSALISLAADLPAPILADLLGCTSTPQSGGSAGPRATGPATSRPAPKRLLVIASRAAQARRR